MLKDGTQGCQHSPACERWLVLRGGEDTGCLSAHGPDRGGTSNHLKKLTRLGGSFSFVALATRNCATTALTSTPAAISCSAVTPMYLAGIGASRTSRFPALGAMVWLTYPSWANSCWKTGHVIAAKLRAKAISIAGAAIAGCCEVLNAHC